jgi:hypothetical protein
MTTIDKAKIDQRLREDGWALVTGLDVDTPAKLAEIRDNWRRAEFREPFTIRQRLGDEVYAAADWGPDREMCLHHEQGSGTEVPGRLILACLGASDSGGAVLLGDTHAVLDNLPAQLLDRFQHEGWLLTRNFRPRLGLPWSATFGTEDPAEVERYCAAWGIDCAWRRDGTLHTQTRRPAVVAHPETGKACWFNDIAFFSQWSVPEVERGVLLGAFGVEGLPFNTGFGDGGQLTAEEWQAILDGYDKVLHRVDWRPGDVLFVDNARTAHGREPYTGTWNVAVALADPVSLRPTR